MMLGIPRLRMVDRARALLILLLSMSACVAGRCEVPAAATAAFNAYVGKIETRLAGQHRLPNGFLAAAGWGAQTDSRLRQGELIIEHLTPANEADVTGALLHHWRGTAFVRGATVADFERLMKNFSGYPRRFSPQVVQAQVISPHDGRILNQFRAMMRVRQHHVITVVMDTSYEVRFGQLDAQHGYSASRSIRNLRDCLTRNGKGTRAERW